MAQTAGFSALKFFPAEAAGGVAYHKSLAGPLPDLVFCQTGGISAEKAPAYLELPNVACVGGSWIATRAMIAAGEWDAISKNAKRAVNCNLDAKVLADQKVDKSENLAPWSHHNFLRTN